MDSFRGNGWKGCCPPGSGGPLLARAGSGTSEVKSGSPPKPSGAGSVGKGEINRAGAAFGASRKRNKRSQIGVPPKPSGAGSVGKGEINRAGAAFGASRKRNKRSQIGVPAEAQRSGFGGERRNKQSGCSFRQSRKRNKRSLFRRYPGLVTGIGPELLQPLDILRLDLPFLGGHFTDGVEVGQGVIDDMAAARRSRPFWSP